MALMDIPAGSAAAATSGFAGPWFLSPRFEQELRERDLTGEQERQVRDFAANGYLVLESTGLDDFDQIAGGIQAELAPLHEEGRFNRVENAWETCPSVRALATAPGLIELLTLLHGRRPIPFQTLNFRKGTEQKTHSDAVHFHCFPKHLMCGVWVALEDTDESNGTLHYYPGSHLLPDIEYADLGLRPGKDFYPRYEAYVEELIEARGLRRERPSLHRGQAVIWAANLLHGGDAIADPARTRLSQVTHFYFEDCSYYTPLRSDLARGKVWFRQIRDVTTGRLVPSRVGGRRIPVPLSSRAVTLQRSLLRRLGRPAVRRFPV